MCVLCGRIDDRHAITAAELAALALSDPGVNKPVLTNDQVTERLHHGQAAWTPGEEIAFGFLTQRPFNVSGSDFSGFNGMGETQKQTVRLALSLWSDVARLDFAEVVDASAIQRGITFANSSSIGEGIWGFAYSTGSVRGVWVNHNDATESWSGRTLGSYDLTATIHEIGHTLTLSHPGNYNASDDDDDNLNYSDDAEYQQDSRQFTLMSYFDASNTGASHGRQFASTPLLHDLLAVQYLYGRNYSTRAGDTVYGFNSTAGSTVLDFTVNRQPIVTLWDGGGHNVLDLSGFSSNSDIDLRSGSFSNVGGFTRNLSIAYGTYIHDAVGGPAADTFQDNALDNRLIGGAGDDVIRANKGGNDSIDGGAGNDILFLFGRADEYAVIPNNDGSLTLHGPAGSLLVRDVEQFRFAGTDTADVAFSLADVTAMNFNPSLYLASNADILAAFGADETAARNHWQLFGQSENRRFDLFDPLEYLAANRDLIDAFGLDTDAATRHYITYGWRENRSLGGFDALSYIASDKDRLDMVGISAVGGLIDYVGTGARHGETISFDGRAYVASYADLRSAIGINKDAGLAHYLNFGVKEDREIIFDPWQYLAANPDLVNNFGVDIDRAYQHYFYYGVNENRELQFDAMDYLGSNPGLAASVGYDTNALTRHYLNTGMGQGLRADRFDAVAYAVTNLISGDDWLEAATRHYLGKGAPDGDNALPFGTDQTRHELTVGTATTDNLSSISDRDWFTFRGAAYTTYNVTIRFLDNPSQASTLAELQLRGQDGVIVDFDPVRTAGLTLSFYTQEAEDVYFVVSGRTATPGSYRITVAIDVDTSQSAAAAMPASAPVAIPAIDLGSLIGVPIDDGAAVWV